MKLPFCNNNNLENNDDDTQFSTACTRKHIFSTFEAHSTSQYFSNQKKKKKTYKMADKQPTSLGSCPEQTRENANRVLEKAIEMLTEHGIEDPKDTVMVYLTMIRDQLEEKLKGEDHGSFFATGDPRAVSAKWFVEESMVVLWGECCKYSFSRIDDRRYHTVDASFSFC